MYQRIFSKTTHFPPLFYWGEIKLIRSKLSILIILCFGLINWVQGQSGIGLTLGEESILLNQLVICGEADEQRVLFQPNGSNTSPRTDISATLQLFPGISFVALNTSESTPGVSLANENDVNQPIFNFPDIDPANPSPVIISFSVKADCSILDTINSSTNLKIFDNWILNYQLNGNNETAIIDGIEYKDALATPNLNLSVEEKPGPFRIGENLTRTVTVINSGLNSYLTAFNYEVIQEPGLVYKSLLVNGVPINFNKTIGTDNDSLISVTITGEYFLNNTQEFGLAGNSDLLFDADEVLLIEEELEIANCGKNGDSNLSSSHQANWGCDGEMCRQEFKTANIGIGVGQELIVFRLNEETVDAGFCEQGSLSITISNNGFEFDDGFGTILDISTGVGFAIGSFFPTADQGFTVNSIRIGESNPILAPTGLIDLNNNQAFAIDPDGEGGLEDFDDDGFFDDLQVGNSFTMTATYSLSCSDGSLFDIEENCDNDFRGNFDAKIIYSNSCSNNNESLYDNFYRSASTGNTKEVCTDPDAFNDNDQFTVIYSGERRITNFNRTCTGNDQIQATITLPDGVALSDKTRLQQDTTNYIPVIENAGNEVLMEFDAAGFNLNNDYALNLVFETQCTAYGPTSFPIDISYFCPDCTCNMIWYCGILEGPVLHTTGAPCDDFVCETGLQTTNFEVERNTFGFTDTSFQTSFNSQLANKKVALTCDSILMKVSSVVGAQSLTDSVGLTINYSNANEQEDDIASFNFGTAEVIIASGGNTNVCQLDLSSYHLERNGNNKIMYFDLSNCLNGIALNPGDRIAFTGYFAVNAAGPIPTNTFKKIPEFRANGYAIIDGVKYDGCDSYGELFRLGKLETTFSGPSNSNYPVGCKQTSLTYTISKSINANAMREFFGEEHRPAIQVDFLQLGYDPGMLSAFDDLSAEYSIQGGAWQSLPPLSALTPGAYNVDFSSMETKSTITGNNQVFQYRINLVPKCSSNFGSTIGDNLYEVEAKINYKNRSYAANNNTDCIETKEDYDKRFFHYEEAPQFTLEALEEEVISAEDNVQWIVEHCNTSFTADAGASFIQVETVTGALEILSIENISDPAAIDTLVLQTYGQSDKFFAFAKGLSKRTLDAVPADVCNVFRITAKVKSCGENSLATRLGWNCKEYDPLNWTPDLYPPCEEESVLLKATTLDPLLAASFEEEASIVSGVLCDTSTMVILVRNEEAGNAYDIQSQIILPKGASLVDGSVRFAYPSTADFQSISLMPNLLEDNGLDKVYQYNDFNNLNAYLARNGLPGFDINHPDSSEFRIQYRFITNCDYENGEVNRYSFQGMSPCGESTNTAFAETNPIIFEADPSLSRDFDFQFSTDQSLTAGESAILEVRVVNTSPNVTLEDKVAVQLPEELTYIPNSIQGNFPDTWTPAEPEIKNKEGIITHNIELPVGLGQNDIAAFQFRVNVGNWDCDSNYIAKITATSTIAFTCTIDGSPCFYDFNSSAETSYRLETDCNPDVCFLSFGTESESVLMPNCDSTIYYCFNQYSPDQLANYTITDNGELVDNSSLKVCNYQQVCIYTYAQIANVFGNIQVDSWTVNGITYTGTVSSITELVDSMNVWDEGGNWSLLPESLIIQGGHVAGAYSRMEVSFPQQGGRSTLGYDTRLAPVGISLLFKEGFHELIITDENNCSDRLNLDIVRQDCPDCTIPVVENVIIENANCGEENGIATINIAQNTSDYTFNWSPNVGEVGIGAHQRVNLPATSYFVQIIDKRSNECFKTVLINVGNAEGPSVSVTTEDTPCGQRNGQAQLSPGNLLYTWNDGGRGANRSELAEGRYIITATDPISPTCTNIITLEINTISNLEVGHTIFRNPNCLNQNGVLALDVTGGSGDYSTSFSDGNLAQNNLSGGVYEITIKDNVTGCSTPYIFTINNEIHKGAIDITSNNKVDCSGEETGSIDFNIVYENGFRFPADTIISDGKKTYENGNLPAGDYQFYILDGNGCAAGNTHFSINGPPALLVNISKEGPCDGQRSIAVQVGGGKAPYNYNWEDLPGSQNEAERTGLENGVYNLTITDSANCELIVPIVLPVCSCDPPSLLEPIIVGASCGQSDGIITLELEEEVQNFTFEWKDGFGQIGSSNNIRTNLPTGDYEVTISRIADPTCNSIFSFTIPISAIGESPLTATNISNADCGLSNGQVEFVFANNNIPYTINWVPDLGVDGILPNTRVSLPAGEYQVIITDPANPVCAYTSGLTILAAPIGAQSTVFPSNCANPPTGAVALTPADYNYTWPDGFIGANRNQLGVGTYSITFTDVDADGCSGILEVEVTGITNLSTEININQEPSCGEANGSVSIDVSGGSGNYSYSWESETNTINNLAAGDYSVTVFDVTLGCQSIADFVLIPNDPGTVRVIITDTLSVSCFGDTDGRVEYTLTVSDDFQGPMDTIITNEVDTFQNGALPPGDYCLDIRDVFGCLAGSACFIIEEPELLELDYTVIAACADTGGIQLNITGGVAPYYSDWMDIDGIDNQGDRIGLDSGLYQVMVMDSKACIEMANIKVPACNTCNLPTITEIATTPSNCSSNTGSIFIKMEENVRDYEYVYTPDVGLPFVLGNIRASMPKGKYKILIIYKANPSCRMEIETEVFEKDFDEVIATTSPAECGLDNGRAQILPPSNRYTWEDGFIGNERVDLAAGFYQVSVRDVGFECDTTLSIIVYEENLLAAKVAIISPPTCGNADGSVSIDVTGGSGNYSFSWAGGENIQNNLSSGTHSVLITDNRTGCKKPFIFSLQDAPSSTQLITINETIDASCPLSADGRVNFIIDLENNRDTTIDTIISNGQSVFDNGQLPQGNYCLIIVDTTGCTLGQACFSIDAPEYLSANIEVIPECDDGGTISILDIQGGIAPFTFDWEDVSGFSDQANRKDLEAGIYSLTLNDANGCQAIFDSLEVILCEPCPLKIGKDTLLYNLSDCAGTQDICLDYDFKTNNPLTISLNQVQIDLFDINSCSTDTIHTYSSETLFGQGRLGPYTITAWPVDDQVFSGDFSSLEELLASMNEWDPAGGWQFSDDKKEIIGGALGSTYGQIEATVQGTPIESFLSYQSNIIQRGINTELGQGVHEMTIQDPKTFCEDTLILVVSCTKIDTIATILHPGQLDSICLPLAELPGNLDTLIIDCIDPEMVGVTVFNDSCIFIQGLTIGQDTICVTVCDDLGVCDTTIIEVDVFYDFIDDTVLVQTLNTFCLDTTGIALEGTIISMTELCQPEDAQEVLYELDIFNHCINYTANTIGVDSACIEICDDLGVCDTLEFFLTINNDPPDRVIDTIFINETIIYCFDSIIFPGDIVFFENICPDESGEFVDFFLDPINFCAEYSGVDLGRESACIVVCDANNVCDTAFFDVEVVDFPELPTAVDDVDTTDKGVPIVLNVKENDIPYGVGEDGMFILDDPMFGAAIPNLDGSITYFGDEFCERSDQFSYVLCNPNGCDTALVTIYIECVDIEVFTAVSPNRDGINDVFYVSRIEEFPESELTIYNRWGNVVYKKINYQNDWSGTYKNDQALPDGTYFYRLELNGLNDDRMFQGFFELHR